MVDWGLIELRETAGGAINATPGTMIARQAAFFLSNGEIVGTDGIRNLVFPVTITNNLYAVVWHRNHIGIMSALPLSLQGGIYSYDFTSGPDQVHGGADGHKELISEIWGMIAADGNADGLIDNPDKENIWNPQAGEAGYKSGDFNMDSEVDNKDKNDYWVPNEGKASQIPE